MPRPYPPCVSAEAPSAAEHRNVAVVSHSQYVPTLTAAAAAALRVKAALSKAAW